MLSAEKLLKTIGPPKTRPAGEEPEHTVPTGTAWHGGEQETVRSEDRLGTPGTLKQPLVGAESSQIVPSVTCAHARGNEDPTVPNVTCAHAMVKNIKDIQSSSSSDVYSPLARARETVGTLPRILPLEAAPEPWPERATDLISWFQTRHGELPTGEFYLNPWTRVSDPAIFYAGLAMDIARGPKGPRAEALVDDLEELFERWAIQNENED